MNIAILPLRAGSKGIPGKNKKKLLGRPLFAWAFERALRSRLDLVVAYSDDEEILSYVEEEYAWSPKARAMPREGADATDGASTESAMHNFVGLLGQSYETITLLQATSPLVRAEDIDAALQAVLVEGYDSALGVARAMRFHWDRSGRPLDYDPAARPRRQEREGQLVENGAVYCSSARAFKDSGCRLSGKIKPVIMAEESLIEIDERSDWPIVEGLARSRLRGERAGIPLPVRIAFLDVDGTLTDGRAAYGKNGEKSKSFSLRDGQGISLLMESGVEVVAITGERSPAAAARMAKLGIGSYFPGTKDKFARASDHLAGRGLSWKETAWIGDDVNDEACMLASSWGICPGDAMPSIASIADLRTAAPGGRGAVREAAEFVISFNRRWES